MYGRDVKVGMRVVPVIKTIEGPLSKSREWAAAIEQGQKYLYVVKAMSPASKGFVCAVKKDAKTGDKFAAIDLRSTSWAGWPCRSAVKAKKSGKTRAKKSAKAKPVAEATAAIAVDWSKNSN